MGENENEDEDEDDEENENGTFQSSPADHSRLASRPIYSVVACYIFNFAPIQMYRKTKQPVPSLIQKKQLQLHVLY